MENLNAKVKVMCAILVLMFCECFFFRNVIGNDLMFGDRGDGRLTNFITEHWWQFFHGDEKFTELRMFYPAHGVLGYSDMFLGFGIIYSMFRLFNVNMFVAYKLTLVIVHGVGTSAMFYLLRRKFKLSIIWSLFGTMAFSFSDSFARNICHTQLMAVSMLPVLLIFFISFTDNFGNRRKRNIFAYLFIFWFALLTYTAWYVAFFTGMFSLVFIVVFSINFKLSHNKLMPLLKRWIAMLGYDLAGYGIFLVIIFIPFVYTYLPVIQLSFGYTFDSAAGFLPEVIDLINVTESNFMIGWLLKLLKLNNRGYSEELAEGFSCVLLLLFLAMFFIQSKRNKWEDDQDNLHSMQLNRIIIKSVFISVITCIVMILRLGSNGGSLWVIVYYLIPMAKSVRAVARFLLWLSFPMSIITAYCANQYFDGKLGKTWKSMIILLLFISNINTVGVSAFWSAEDELAFIQNISAPPEDAESFYIIDSEKMQDVSYIYQLDAFEIAEFFSLKTINGYSGQSPIGWGNIWDVSSETYESSINHWVNDNGLTNVYAYDRAANIWIPYEDRLSSLIDSAFYPSEGRFSLSSGLQDYNQDEFVWTGQDFETIIRNSEIRETGLNIKLSIPLKDYMAQNPELEPKIELYIDGEFIQDILVNEGYVEYVIPMADHISDDYKIELRTNCYFNPQFVGINEDTRNLSIALYYIGN